MNTESKENDVELIKLLKTIFTYKENGGLYRNILLESTLQYIKSQEPGLRELKLSSIIQSMYESKQNLNAQVDIMYVNELFVKLGYIEKEVKVKYYPDFKTLLEEEVAEEVVNKFIDSMLANLE